MGFVIIRSVKSYLSFIHPAEHVEYVSEILDGGSQVIAVASAYL